MPFRHFRRQCDQFAQLRGGRINGMMEPGWSARRVSRRFGLSDCVVMKCWEQWIREIDKSRFNLSGDDNRVRVWRPRGERLNPAFGLQRHSAPTADVMVWGAIACNTQSSLVLVHGNMKAQRQEFIAQYYDKIK
ncbi:UNVERIFIED_CONTAM: hypothetical protein NCL1_06476 [Trichonephila clavipes]